jgi:RNA binding exosome subunit
MKNTIKTLINQITTFNYKQNNKLEFHYESGLYGREITILKADWSDDLYIVSFIKYMNNGTSRSKKRYHSFDFDTSNIDSSVSKIWNKLRANKDGIVCLYENKNVLLF